MNQHGLSPKQMAFVTEFMKDRNGKQACIRAGYSPRSAEMQASRLLSKDNVKKAVDFYTRQIESRTLVTAQYVIENLMEVVERCMQRSPVMVRQGGEMVQAKDEEGRDVWEFDSAGANKALESLGRHLKMFTDKFQHDMSTGIAERMKKAEERMKNEA